jgi:hypothetical protein
MMQYKIEIDRRNNGVWEDVRGADGAVLIFDDEASARATLAELFPVEFQLEKYSGPKRTRVIRILRDEDDWPQRPKPG